MTFDTDNLMTDFYWIHSDSKYQISELLRDYKANNIEQFMNLNIYLYLFIFFIQINFLKLLLISQPRQIYNSFQMKTIKKQKEKKQNRPHESGLTLTVKKKAGNRLDKVKSSQYLQNYKSRQHQNRNNIRAADQVKKLQRLKDKYTAKDSPSKQADNLLLEGQQKNVYTIKNPLQKEKKSCSVFQSPLSPKMKDKFSLRKKMLQQTAQGQNTLVNSNIQWRYPQTMRACNISDFIKQEQFQSQLAKNNELGLKNSKKSDQSNSNQRDNLKTSRKKLQNIGKPMRYKKFAFRSQKYIRLSSELQLENNGKSKIQLKKAIGLSNSQQLPTSPSSKNFKKDNEQINSLQKQIQYYKNMGDRSEKVLSIMNNVLNQQTQKLNCQKKFYKDQIAKLKQRIEERKLKVNLGHLFSYNEFDIGSLIPNQIIIQKNQHPADLIESSISDFQELKKKGEEIIQYYETLDQNTQEQNLSIYSKQ